MKIAAILLLFVFCFACGTKTPSSSSPNTTKPTNSAPQTVSQPTAIKDGDYNGSGKVTKINNDLGSVELDHGDIPGLMPAMLMEFYVSDKTLLKGLSVGDMVDFVILYKGGTETITKITKK